VIEYNIILWNNNINMSYYSEDIIISEEETLEKDNETYTYDGGNNSNTEPINDKIIKAMETVDRLKFYADFHGLDMLTSSYSVFNLVSMGNI
jgi:hypothetical protein